MYKKPFPEVHSVDFDGLLCEDRYPEIGEPRTDIIAFFKALKAAGDILILNTCRCNGLVDDAIKWCEKQGLVFDAINYNLPDRVKQYAADCRKISADYYWDDKNMSIDDIFDYVKYDNDTTAPRNANQKTTLCSPCSGVRGVSVDTETVTNEQGGKQSKSAYAFHLCDYDALLAIAETLQKGIVKYERDNWRLIPAEEHFNHMLIHALAYLKGDQQDDHLGHMITRAMMFYATAKAEAI